MTHVLLVLAYLIVVHQYLGAEESLGNIRFQTLYDQTKPPLRH